MESSLPDYLFSEAVYGDGEEIPLSLSTRRKQVEDNPEGYDADIRCILKVYLKEYSCFWGKQMGEADFAELYDFENRIDNGAELQKLVTDFDTAIVGPMYIKHGNIHKLRLRGV